MGVITQIKCTNCQFEQSFFVGMGFSDCSTGKSRELFFCPSCKQIVTRKVKPSNQTDPKVRTPFCRKCGVRMERITNETNIICPECKTANCVISTIGFWD